jgi:putative DNA primase/helicase
MAFACECLSVDIPVDLLASCLMHWKIGEHVRDQKNVDRALSRLITEAEGYVKRRRSGLPVIRVEKGKEHVAWREVQRALLRAACQVYVRASALVEPLWREEPTEHGKTVMCLSLVPYNRTRLTDQVAHNAAAFEAYDGRSKKHVPIDPPPRVIDTLLERQDWDFPSITGVINTPTMRPDGTLLLQDGYDRQTRLWLKADDLELPELTEKPTKEDAAQALELLRGLLKGFPFVTDTDLSVALAGMLTVVLRGAFDVAPLFFISKPEAGTGGSYLVKLISVLATGQAAPPLILSNDKQEMQKELTAKASQGRPIINLNNLTFDLDSPLLCQMVTEGMVDVRPFGKNDQTVSCDCRGTTVFANGNNVSVVGDLVRRTLTTRMNAGQERPETRTFDFDPVQMVLSDRGKYLAAVFTIARANIAAGSPQMDCKPLAGFEGWMSKVCRPLLCLGQADPTSSMMDARSLDPTRIDLKERLEADSVGLDKDFTAARVHELGSEMTTSGPYSRAGCSHPKLLAAFSRDGKPLSSKSIGWLLKRDINRWSGDYSLCLVNDEPMTYRVVSKNKSEVTDHTEQPKPGVTM